MQEGHSPNPLCGRLPNIDSHLTFRQIEILVMAAAGSSSSVIAHTLNISARTVDQHFAIMLMRMGAVNRCELVARAYATGILIANTWPPEWSGLQCTRVTVAQQQPTDNRPARSA